MTRDPRAARAAFAAAALAALLTPAAMPAGAAAPAERPAACTDFYGHVNADIHYFSHKHLGGLDWQRNGTGVASASGSSW